MKRFCFLLAGIATAVLLLTSCLPADMVAKEVKKALVKEIANNPEYNLNKAAFKSLGVSDIQVTDVTLVHEGGNRYTGFVTFKVQYWGIDEQERYPINVICDGTNYLWEIHFDEK